MFHRSFLVLSIALLLLPETGSAAESDWTRMVRDAATPLLPQGSGPLKVSGLRLPDHLRSARPAQVLRIRFRQREDFSGPSSVCIERDGRCQWVSVRFALKVLAPVAQRRLARGAPVRAGDFTLEPVDARDIRGPRLGLAELEGRILSSDIRKGVPAQAHMFKRPIVIRRGDRVRITAGGRGLTIQAQGIAKASGRVGDRIPVINLGSKKRLNARVLSTGQVSCQPLGVQGGQ